MLNKKAAIKSVRPFKKVSALTVSDENFLTWSQKTWDKLYVEIGCGAGLHPIQKAISEKSSGLIALERTKTKFNAFNTRLTHHSLPNIYPVNKDALFWLPGNIKNNSIDKYFLLYPNPYPKEEQANKRWHRSSLMYFILETLKTGGTITTASNEEWYLDECRDYMKNYWGLKLIEDQLIKDIENFKPRTHFERKYLKRNHPCRNLVFQKN